jgi:hypothetical protein
MSVMSEDELKQWLDSLVVEADGFWSPTREIIANSIAGKILIDREDLPCIETVQGKPKAPTQPQGYPASTPEEKVAALRREALEKLALAEWWAEEAARRESARAELQRQITEAPHDDAERLANYLVTRGWRR